MKIIISDFDNTFFTNDIDKNVELINQFMEKGNIFIIATGRPLYLLRPELEKHKIKYNYLICNDGAVIFDDNEKIIDKTNIDYYTAIEIYNILKRDINIEHVYIDGIYDFQELDATDFNGILGLPIDREKVGKTIKDICKKYPSIQGYLSHRWINILNIDASKGNAIKYLQNKFGWKDENIYVIGDNINDLSMRIYENSYAVRNGNLAPLNKFNHVVENFKEMVDSIK